MYLLLIVKPTFDMYVMLYQYLLKPDIHLGVLDSRRSGKFSNNFNTGLSDCTD